MTTAETILVEDSSSSDTDDDALNPFHESDEEMLTVETRVPSNGRYTTEFSAVLAMSLTRNHHGNQQVANGFPTRFQHAADPAAATTFVQELLELIDAAVDAGDPGGQGLDFFEDAEPTEHSESDGHDSYDEEDEEDEDEEISQQPMGLSQETSTQSLESES